MNAPGNPLFVFIRSFITGLGTLHERGSEYIYFPWVLVKMDLQLSSPDVTEVSLSSWTSLHGSNVAIPTPESLYSFLINQDLASIQMYLNL